MAARAKMREATKNTVAIGVTTVAGVVGVINVVTNVVVGKC